MPNRPLFKKPSRHPNQSTLVTYRQMKHATHFTILSRHVWHAPFLLGIAVASSAMANDGLTQLKDLRIGAVNAGHFAGSSCRFWTTEMHGAPGPKVIIETDFAKAWLNVKGRDMSFQVVNTNDYVTVLQTPVGKIELTDITDPTATSDDLTLASYRMSITEKTKRTRKTLHLIARCE